MGALFDRLREPSTGIAIAGLFGLFVPKYAVYIPDAVNAVGTLAGIVLAAVNSEKKP